MKRFLSMLMALILVLSLVPVFPVLAADPVTVYIDPKNGSNDNAGTEESPVQNFTKAYEFLQEGGGTVIMLSSVYYAGTYTFPACDYPVTITGKTGAEGIRTGSNIVVSGDTTFQNMTFTMNKASVSTLICGNGHKLVMGEGLTCVPFVEGSNSYYFCLQGSSVSTTGTGADMTILSGQYRNVYAGASAKTVNGDVRLTMTGGTASVVSASYSSAVNGDVEISLSGSANVTTVYAGAWLKSAVGNVTVTLGQGATVKNLYSAGNGTGNVTSTTVILDGYDQSLSNFKGTGGASYTGTLGSSTLLLKSGILRTTPVGFTNVHVEVPRDKTLTLAAEVSADTLKSEGSLCFSGPARLTAGAVTGSVACTIAGDVLKNQVYVTAPAGSAISFPTETGITERSGQWVNHDLTDFAGLVVASDSANKLNLYGGIWAHGTSTVYTIVEPYLTETVDGITYRYYPNATGGYHVRSSRSGYITLYKNIYMSAEEAAVKTVETITLDKKGANGFVPQTMYSHTTEVLGNEDAWKSETSMFPKYENALDIPVFESGRDPQQMTTQTELWADIRQQDKPGDHMYVFTLGQSGDKGYDIPLVIFTRTDLSSATTLEQAAALMGNDKLTVYYRAQMHGNEPAGAEGALGMIHHLQDGYADQILDKLNLIIVPRLGTDNSELYQRLLPNGINPNRDQMRIESAEMYAFQKGFMLFDPDVVLDGHERVWNNSKGDIQVTAAFTTMNSDAYRTLALEMDEAAFAELAANELNGFYYAANVSGYDPNMGSAYYAITGTAMYVLMESRGIYGGNESMERRAVAHMAAVSGMLDYLHENADHARSVIRGEGQRTAENGKTYSESNVFVLDTNSRTTTSADKETWGILNTAGQVIDWGSGEVSFPVTYPKVDDVVVRSRVLPTAYAISADCAGIDTILKLMDDHGISYSFLPEGATLPLQRYGGTGTEATLGMETATRFAKGCYVFTMNQVRGLLLASFMEPDHTNSAEFDGNLVQMGLLNVTDTYRYVRNLNTAGTVDYTVTDADLVNVTVYLDSTNGLDTNDGLTEATAVATVEQAYAVMAAALEGAEEGSVGTLVILGLYDLGAKQSHLPEAGFPVVITGKTAADGFSFTGGTSQATRTFEIHGETTFQNVTLHINNTQSFNFLLANGHKLVIGQGVNTTTNKANCYFTLCGGDYDYTDSNASSDITVRSGSWRTIYAGGYRASITGLAKADISNCYVYNNIAATYCGNVGQLDMRISDTEVEAQGTSAIYVGPLDYSVPKKLGAIQGDALVTLGKNVTAQGVYTSSRTHGFIYGTATVVADGVDLTKAPVYAIYATTKGSTAAALLKLNANVTQDVTLDAALPVDLNGYDIIGNVTVDGTLTVKDSATDDYTVADGACGEITGTITGTLVAADGYIAAANGFHKFDQYISGVSLRPANAGIYYTSTVLCDEVLADCIAASGVAVSLVDLPGADFETDEDTLYSVGRHGVMIQNILKGDTDDIDRAITDIYAASYVKLTDGTVLVSENEIAYSLYEVVKLLDSSDHADALKEFYQTWESLLSAWELEHIGK